MSEWIHSTVGDVTVTQRAGGTPTASVPNFYGGEIPFVTIEDITAAGRYLDKTQKFLTELGLNSSAAWLIKEPQILYSMYATIGKPIINKIPCATSQAIIALKVADCIGLEFLYYQLDFIRPGVFKYTAQTTQSNLNAKSVRSIPICYPKSTTHQDRIVRILNGVDASIEKTESLIEKYQHIKAGLMHDLFTRGVLPNGQLRPRREEAPELYQETAIGWIPKGWNVSALNELLAPVANNIRSGPFGSALLKHELVNDGIPFLGIDNIHTEHFESSFRRFVDANKFAELAKYKVRPRDVVITIMGTVGRCCVIPEDLDLALSSKHLWTMTFDPEKVIPELVCWQLNHAAWAQAWFRRAMQGGIMDAIQSSTLKNLRLPVPSLGEQAQIHARYLRISTKIRQESAQVEKLKKQKSGLMQDLLTGKVPVPVPEHEATDG
ncbi:restriction endonuclease S subunit [Vitreoscilla filiformis]|uniref:Restriction endonuclease S subunit n=1 Tax=Vitreoscilla filiformis TaxID=63 RepID=A0A221KH00_VITFI|nr:restriction endonuclease subunit S [Vitreoscilla filiformis]ASM78199.1 restriction endonuclease S subunit [Vitreoscilla filiformis]